MSTGSSRVASSAASARATSSAQTTPNAPSSQPPVGCVSECEPTSSALPGLRERPSTLPTPSIVASRPASA